MSRKEYWEHFGKWLVFTRDRAWLRALAEKIDPYVERGKINSAKYSREPSSSSRGSVVMCVYCSDRKRDEVWKILSGLGVKRQIWKYDRQTAEDWSPGGRLYEAHKREQLENLRSGKSKTALIFEETEDEQGQKAYTLVELTAEDLKEEQGTARSQPAPFLEGFDYRPVHQYLP